MLKNVRIYKRLQLPLRSVLRRFGSSYPLCTRLRGRRILRTWTSDLRSSTKFARMEFSEDHILHSGGPTPIGRPWVSPAAFGVLQLCMHKLGRESMTNM